MVLCHTSTLSSSVLDHSWQAECGHCLLLPRHFGRDGLLSVGDPHCLTQQTSVWAMQGVPTFNDDIQATAAVSLAALYGATRLHGVPSLLEQTFLFFGAGQVCHRGEDGHHVGKIHLATMRLHHCISIVRQGEAGSGQPALFESAMIYAAIYIVQSIRRLGLTCNQHDVQPIAL